MKVVAAYRPNLSKTNLRVEAVAKALRAKETTRDQPLKGTDLVIQAGFQISPVLEDAMERGIPFLILENGIWHDGVKYETYTIGYNGLNGLAYVPPAPRLPRRHPELLPWKNPQDGDITIFGQVVNDKSLRGADIEEWMNQCQQLIPSAGVRPHPWMHNSWDVSALEPFEKCLQRTSIAVTYSSTVGAEAVIAGIPTVAMHPGSFAWDVATHDLHEAPITPERDRWLHELSWRHWNINENLNVGWLLGGYDNARALAEQGIYDNCSNGREQDYGQAANH